MIRREGVIEWYECISCKNEIVVRVHPVESPIPLETTVYKAVSSSSDAKQARRALLLVKKVFAGMSNFYLDELNQQISNGESTWALGYYSQAEVDRLGKRAAEVGLNVEFLPCESR